MQSINPNVRSIKLVWPELAVSANSSKYREWWANCGRSALWLRLAVVPDKADRENWLENLDITHPCPSVTGQKEKFVHVIKSFGIHTTRFLADTRV